MARFSRFVVTLALVTTGCSDDGRESRVVCAPEARTVLVAEELNRLVPSMPFEVAPGEEAWATVLTDASYDPNALVPRVRSLLLIEAGAEPRIREDTNGLKIIDDPAIPFDTHGEWRPATAVPGRYQVWSTGVPVIEVAACPAPVDGA